MQLTLVSFANLGINSFEEINGGIVNYDYLQALGYKPIQPFLVRESGLCEDVEIDQFMNRDESPHPFFFTIKWSIGDLNPDFRLYRVFKEMLPHSRYRRFDRAENPNPEEFNIPLLIYKAH